MRTWTSSPVESFLWRRRGSRSKLAINSILEAFKHLERIVRSELLQAMVLERGEACLPC